jgi:hypothetical protein
VQREVVDPTDTRRAIQIARWQVMAGWVTVLATLVARLITVVLQLRRSHLDVELFVESLFKSALLFAVAYQYRRHLWPSYLMAAVFPIGFVLTLLNAHPPPTVVALGLAVGLAFFAGARGMHTLRARNAIPGARQAAVASGQLSGQTTATEGKGSS